MAPEELSDTKTYCQWHPNVETRLRCYSCGALICAKCAHHTPVGYLCPDCRHGRKQRFDHARTADYLIATGVSLVLGGLAGWVLPLTGWFVLFLSPLAGTLTAEAVWRLVGRRYGQHLWWIVAGGLALGGLPQLAFALLGALISLGNGYSWGILGILWPAAHIALAVGAVVARLRLK
ncbi:MAG: zinc finger, RING-type domain-containing protein [Chloroflexota bacterium]|nr:zinc finger, RING-type domain-containing protein [Chloroflexota bacterium]